MAVPQSFPAKIYQILENESPEIIQWNENGLSFRIVDHARFEREIVPKYFRHNQISSVQRQLNLYGFKCISRGEYKRSFFHPKFRRGDWETVKTLTRYVPVKKNTPTPSQQGDDGSEVGKDPRGGMHPFMPFMYSYHPNMPPNQQMAAMMHHGYQMPPNAGGSNGQWSESWHRPSSSSANPSGPGNMSPPMGNGIAMYPHGNMSPAQMSPTYMPGPSNVYNNHPSPRSMGDNGSVSSLNVGSSAMSHDPSMVAATAAAASHYGGAGQASMEGSPRAGGVQGAHNQPAYFGAGLPRDFKSIPSAPMSQAMMPTTQPSMHPAYTNQSHGVPTTNASCGSAVRPAGQYSRASSGNLPTGADYDLMVDFGMFDSFAIPDSLGNSLNASGTPTAAPSVVNLPGHGEAATAPGQLSLVPTHAASLLCHDSSHSTISSPSHASTVTASVGRVPAAVQQCDVGCNTELTYDPVTDSFVRRANL